jgi:hypothetical protein
MILIHRKKKKSTARHQRDEGAPILDNLFTGKGNIHKHENLSETLANNALNHILGEIEIVVAGQYSWDMTLLESLDMRGFLSFSP